MPDFGLQRDWKQFLTYEMFERVASRIVMLFISIIIVYSLILMAITLVDHFRLNPTYLDTESLRDVFGSRKVILLDFATATFEQILGIGAVALAFGLLFWLIGARSGGPTQSQSPN